MTPDYITRVVIFYDSASGRTRMVDFETPKGAEHWTPEDWLNEACATAYVRENWQWIEATRDAPRLRVRHVRGNREPTR